MLLVNDTKLINHVQKHKFVHKVGLNKFMLSCKWSTLNVNRYVFTITFLNFLSVPYEKVKRVLILC